MAQRRAGGTLVEGDVVDGEVTRRKRNRVFVDIGGTQACVLGRPPALRRLDVGTQINGMTVERIHPDRGVLVSAPDLPRVSLLYEDLRVGMKVNGDVCQLNGGKAFIDIGSEVDARALVPTRSLRSFRMGARFNNLTIEKIDQGQKQVYVSVPGLPKLLFPGDILPGDKVEGVVSFKSENSLFVDIGFESNAKVLTPRSETDKFAMGEKIKLMFEGFDERSRPLVTIPGAARLIERQELKKGMSFDGKVQHAWNGRVLIDFGCVVRGIVMADRKEACRKLPHGSWVQGMRIERIPEEGDVEVSVPGISALKSIAEYEEGDTVDGKISLEIGPGGMRFVDIGCDQLAVLRGEWFDTNRLYPLEEVSVVVSKIDRKRKSIAVRLPGLKSYVFERERVPISTWIRFRNAESRVPDFDDLVVGQSIPGTLRGLFVNETWVDIGKYRSVMMVNVSQEQLDHLRVKEPVNVTVVRVDVERGQVDVTLNNVEELLDGRRPRKRRPLEDFKVGSEVQATVLNFYRIPYSGDRTQFDFGAESPAKMRTHQFPVDKIVLKELRKFTNKRVLVKLEEINLDNRSVFATPVESSVFPDGEGFDSIPDRPSGFGSRRGDSKSASGKGEEFEGTPAEEQDGRDHEVDWLDFDRSDSEATANPEETDSIRKRRLRKLDDFSKEYAHEKLFRKSHSDGWKAELNGPAWAVEEEEKEEEADRENARMKVDSSVRIFGAKKKAKEEREARKEASV